MRSVRTVSKRTQHWALAGAVALGALAGCAPARKPASSTVAARPEIDATMRIVHGAFVPPIVFAHAGGPVTIVNLDPVAHRLTGRGLASVSIPGGGGVYSFQAPGSGTSTYNCDYRAAVKGEVFVV